MQAAATERAVESLGHTCEIIDYFVKQDNALFAGPPVLAAPPPTFIPPCITRLCAAGMSGLSSSLKNICASLPTGLEALRSCGRGAAL